MSGKSGGLKIEETKLLENKTILADFEGPLVYAFVCLFHVSVVFVVPCTLIFWGTMSGH